MRHIFILLTLISLPLQAQNTSNPQCKCCTEQHQKFDFWTGEWEVVSAEGTKLGENTIEKIQNNCVLRENWKSTNGNFTGTSYNFYNISLSQWEQIWVDNQGNSLHLKGNRVGNQMILKTDEATNKEGKPIYHKVTWTKNNDGTVRQLWETITNESTITVAFDGIYKKIEE